MCSGCTNSTKVQTRRQTELSVLHIPAEMTVSKLRVENEDAGSNFILGFVKFPPDSMTSNVRRHYAQLSPAKVLESTISIQPSWISIETNLLILELTSRMSRQ